MSSMTEMGQSLVGASVCTSESEEEGKYLEEVQGHAVN